MRNLLLKGVDEKRIAINIEKVCSIEEESVCCLITYAINEQYYRSSKVINSFDDILTQISSFN